MSEKTGIEWAHATFNPWIGCTKVSPGCAHCYAETMDRRRYSKTMDGGTKEKPVSHWGKNAPRHRTSKQLWTAPLRWDTEVAAHPDYRHRVFPSLCDWLDDEVPIEWLADFMKLIHDTPNLDWLLLTKRPENWDSRIIAVHYEFANRDDRSTGMMLKNWKDNPPHNVWLGVSVEDQKRADERIPLLLQIPAKVRFLSVEPLLEAVDLSRFLPVETIGGVERETWPNWVIVGGESGPHRRDCGVDAISKVALQCLNANVPCFVKQDSAMKPGQKGRIPDDVWALKQFPTCPR